MSALPKSSEVSEHNQAVNSTESSSHLKAAKIVDLSEHMADAFAQLEHPALREVLLESVAAERESIEHIRNSFVNFTAAKHDIRKRRTFFASWQRTKKN